MDEALLRVEAVTHRLGQAGSPAVLHDVDLTIEAGEYVALAGRSGSGKSTLCHLVAGLGRPTSGVVLVDGRPAEQIDDWSVVSLLPQRLALIEELSVAENALLPFALHRRSASRAQPWSGAAALADDPSSTANDGHAELLEILSLTALGDRLARQTSLGEQQRTALARALVLRPRLTVLDEPTGHQDDDNVTRVLAAIALAREHGTAVLVATHDERVLESADRVVALHDGRVSGRTAS